MKSSENTKKYIVIALLVLFNITLILSLVLFAVQYSRNVRLQKEKAAVRELLQYRGYHAADLGSGTSTAELESAQSWLHLSKKSI